MKQTLSLADKMVFYQKEMGGRRSQAIEEAGQIQPRITNLVQVTKDLQKKVGSCMVFKNTPSENVRLFTWCY